MQAPGLTVWKSAVSSLSISSSRMAALLWVTLPMSFHLGQGNVTRLYSNMVHVFTTGRASAGNYDLAILSF